MITIETKRGQITAETKPIIRNLVEALPDGQHIVNIYTAGSAISEASKIAEWFNSIPVDFNDIAFLQKQMSALAFYCFEYTKELGNASVEKRAAQTRYAIDFVKSKLALKAAGESTTDAREKAKVANGELMMNEAIAEAQHEVVAAQLRALNGILTAMTMHLSMLKKEGDWYKQGNNADFPTK
jgi:hypothetical protein